MSYCPGWKRKFRRTREHAFTASHSLKRLQKFPQNKQGKKNNEIHSAEKVIAIIKCTQQHPEKCGFLVTRAPREKQKNSLLVTWHYRAPLSYMFLRGSYNQSQTPDESLQLTSISSRSGRFSERMLDVSRGRGVTRHAIQRFTFCRLKDISH